LSIALSVWQGFTSSAVSSAATDLAVVVVDAAIQIAAAATKDSSSPISNSKGLSSFGIFFFFEKF